MHFSRARMAGLRVIYFVLILAILIVLKVQIGFSNTVLAVLVVGSLAVVLASYPIQMRLISSVAYRKRELGPEAMIGLEGTAIERLSPLGRVRVRGETWKARSTGGTAERGDDVMVTGIGEGLTLLVRPKTLKD
jgi:membrane-bound serine protease (ClpP class)